MTYAKAIAWILFLTLIGPVLRGGHLNPPPIDPVRPATQDIRPATPQLDRP